jgi:ribosome biogenesis GTPase
VSGLDRNFNPKRIQRFLVAAHDSGAAPVIVLNKADLCDDADEVRREVEALAPGVPVLVTSTATRKGLKGLTATYGQSGQTLAFIGSSGVGKSSLINALVKDPEALPTAEVREKDSKGRHTTTRRELVKTPLGALVIDTPGMRELQLWGADGGLDETFPEIRELALRCRFTNCTHGNEPGCAVRVALESSALLRTRFAAYEKLKAEQDANAPRERKPGALASKPSWKQKAEGRAPFRHREWRED